MRAVTISRTDYSNSAPGMINAISGVKYEKIPTFLKVQR
jgi:hypothetical protein